MSEKVIREVVKKGAPIVIKGAEFMSKEELKKAKKAEKMRRYMARVSGKEPLERATKQTVRLVEESQLVEMAQSVRNKVVMLLDKKLEQMNNDDELLDKVNLATLATTFGILFDKAQLAKGLSTQNIAIQARVDVNMSSEKALEELNKMREVYQEEQTNKQ